MSARKPFNPDAPITDMRLAQAALNRINNRPATVPLQTEVKRQSRRAAFEKKLIERPVLSPEGAMTAQRLNPFLLN